MYDEECCDVETAVGDTAMVPDTSNGMYTGITYDTREYDSMTENGFVSTADRPLSTFAADRDTASYSNVRSYIESGSLPPDGAVRIEEMLNYFTYDYRKKPEERLPTFSDVTNGRHFDELDAQDMISGTRSLQI